MKVIDGRKIAKEIREELKRRIAKISGRRPGLAFILLGENPASQAYVRMKRKGCHEIGIHSEILNLPLEVTEEALKREIERLNQEQTIDGILVQQPFPKQISTSQIVEAIDPAKDVDGFHPMNIGKLLLGEEGGFAACTPLAIVKLLEKSGAVVEGKHVVILGRSNIVGKPLAALLMQKQRHCNATVTIAHSGTENLNEICQSGDILVAAIGSPLFIKAEMVKKGAVVIDVGINHTDQGLVGDVDFESVKEVASMITPVPGGVGPMTIAMLLSNTYESFQKRCAT
ncbi:MAG: Bifunctional protein FolD protein [Chlamydiae bacterium]|nr:Bifunctional protein FolD protein [Chlamydiota bacterium]